MFRRLLIANRGEVAVRVARTCVRLGIEPVFAVSSADASLSYASEHEHVCIGPSASAQSYLDARRLIEAAKIAHCTAVHPGWGFLSESPEFAALCAQHGLAFIGPTPAVTSKMGKKIPAKRAMEAAGLRVIPGSEGIVANVDEAAAVAYEVGYPVLLKAESGGGGRGMRIAETANDLATAFADAAAEAKACFGDDRLYLEKLIRGGRHVEIQVMADTYGNVVHIGERDCSVQRNHQKLIEESPAPSLSPEERERTLAAAVQATRALGYVGAGTLEFLLDADGALRFMEMNTRLQVEHCVSEMRSGLDLVEAQIRVAAGQRLPFTQEEVSLKGHAIEVRLNAEDVDDAFKPSPGVLSRFEFPADDHIRVDTHMRTGDEVSPYYDSLIGKLIVFGATRDEAVSRMLSALESTQIEGVKTTMPLHQKVLASKQFQSNDYDINVIPGWS